MSCFTSDVAVLGLLCSAVSARYVSICLVMLQVVHSLHMLCAMKFFLFFVVP